MRTLAFLGLVAVVACGGSTAIREPGDASSDGAGSSSGGGSGSGSGGGGSGSSSGSGSGGSSGSSGGSGGSSSSSGGGTTCQDVENQINQLRPAAQACCPTCNHAPCAFLVADLCCPITVDSQSSSAVTAFEQAVQQFNTLKCAIACPGLVCQTMPSGNCNATTSMCQ